MENKKNTQKLEQNKKKRKKKTDMIIDWNMIHD